MQPSNTPNCAAAALCGLLDLFGVLPDEENALEWEALQVLQALPADDLATILDFIDRTRSGLKRYITVKGLAEKFSVKPKTIRRLIRAGALPASTRKGKIVFDLADIDRWLSTHTFIGLCQDTRRPPAE